MSESVKVEIDGGVWLITIDRPDKMNALDFTAHDELVATWLRFRDDAAARVAVLTGAGDKAFCAGADLKTYTMAFATAPPHEFRQKWVDGYGLGGITRGLDIDKPIIAAVNGYAISGGLEIALACDLRFAAPNAQFGLQDSKWGFHACDGGLVRLPRIVGEGHAMEMILSGELIDADHAHRIGLVNRVWPAEELLARSLAYAQMLAKRAPLSHRFAKNVMRRMAGLTLDEALKAEVRSFYDLGGSEDLAEGTASFRERREARFKGR